MAFGKLGRSLTALEIFDLVRHDLDQVEREIGLESIASVEAVTYIGQYLQTGRRQASAPHPGAALRKTISANRTPCWSAWPPWWR